MVGVSEKTCCGAILADRRKAGAVPGYCLATGSPQVGKELDWCCSIVSRARKHVNN